MNADKDTWDALPVQLRKTVEAQLAGDEKPLVWLEPDLDGRLHFASGLVVLTDRRLLDIGPTEAVAAARRGPRADVPFRAWPLAAIQGLRAKEHAGVGSLELLGAESLLGQWRYTIGRAPRRIG